MSGCRAWTGGRNVGPGLGVGARTRVRDRSAGQGLRPRGTGPGSRDQGLRVQDREPGFRTRTEGSRCGAGIVAWGSGPDRGSGLDLGSGSGVYGNDQVSGCRAGIGCRGARLGSGDPGHGQDPGFAVWGQNREVGVRSWDRGSESRARIGGSKPLVAVSGWDRVGGLGLRCWAIRSSVE